MAREDGQFSKNRQPDPKRRKGGRPKSHLRAWVKENHVGTLDVRIMMQNVLSNAPNMAWLNDLLTNPKTPPIILFPVKSLLQEFVDGKLETFKWLMRYGWGEPKQEIEQVNIDMDVTNMTRQQRAEAKLNALKNLVKNNKEEVQKLLDENK